MMFEIKFNKGDKALAVSPTQAWRKAGWQQPPVYPVQWATATGGSPPTPEDLAAHKLYEQVILNLLAKTDDGGHF